MGRRRERERRRRKGGEEENGMRNKGTKGREPSGFGVLSTLQVGGSHKVLMLCTMQEDWVASGGSDLQKRKKILHFDPISLS